MRKQIIIPGLAALYLLLSFGCGSKSFTWLSDRDRANIKADVKFYDERYYGFYGGNKVPLSGVVRHYNEQGFLTEETLFGRNNSFMAKNAFDHDETGRPVAARRMDQQGIVLYNMKYFYLPEQRQIRVESYAGETSDIHSIVLRSLNEEGRLINEKVTDPEGKLYVETKMKLNEQGLLASSQQVEGESGEIALEQSFVYSDDGVVIKSQTFDEHAGKYENTFKYLFDDKGNWTLRETYKDGDLVEVTERVIQYRDQ